MKKSDCYVFPNGSILNLSTGNILKGTKRSKKHNDYLRVSIDGKLVHIHILVAEKFLGKKPNGKVCNHIDGNKSNNDISNLEYITPSENNYHAIRTGLVQVKYGDSHHNSKVNSDQVILIRIKRMSGRTFNSLSNEYGISSHSIADICKYRTWPHISF